MAHTDSTPENRYEEFVTPTLQRRCRSYKLLESDSIIEHILVENPNFNDLDALTKEMENGTLEFIEDVMTFFSKNLIGSVK